MKKKIIILLSTYNGEKYLNQQLESIYNQITDCGIELFVRDDGSRDGTMDILKLWSDKLNISFLNDSENIGPAKSFWKLLLNAPEADYYAFVDQDDIWDGDKLETAVNALGTTEEKVLWFSNCRIISHDGKVLNGQAKKEPPILTVASQFVCGITQGCSMVFNKAALNYFKNLDLDYIPMHDDVALTYMLAVGKVVYESRPLFSYRVHSGNVVAKQGYGKFKKLISSFKRLFGKKYRFAKSKFAKQALKDLKYELDNETVGFLESLIKCRKSLRARRKVCKNPLLNSPNKAAVRSFKLRVKFGVI